MVRHHVGLAFLMQFHARRVTACRPCGRKLVRGQTLRTLWMGWWGPISFFFNWFVLAANLRAWRQLGALEAPPLSGELVTATPRGFDHAAADDQPAGRSRLRRAPAVAVLGFVALGLAGWGWDATHHDHDEAHGVPASVVAVQETLADGPFMAADHTVTMVTAAVCSGSGDAALGGYTHFDCGLTFDDGTGDEVLVHLLENGELVFKSSVGTP